MTLTAAQRTTFESIFDTFAPGDGNGIPSATRLGAVHIAEGMLAANPRPEEAEMLAKVLSIWDTPVGGLLLGIGPRRFSSLPADRREAALIALGDSNAALKRTIFQNLKSAAMLSYYISPGADGTSPLWDAMGYPGPLGSRTDAAPAALHPITPVAALSLSCDVVVVGSGAGGGTAAAVLSAAGLDVIVLEKGAYYDDGDFDGGEAAGLARLYAPGPSATAEGQLSLLAAQCLGGGTVVNFSTSFRTPDHVRAEWAALGVSQFAGAEYDAAMDAVWQRLGVTAEYSIPSRRDQIMERGLTALGWHVGELQRNVKGCDTGVECGRCGYGCRIGAKQSVAKTWLADAEAAGARLYTGVDVRAIEVQAGRPTGVTGRTADGHEVTVRARAVVVAAGSVQTPALLRRSGLTNPNIGKHLRLHPATAVWAEFDEEVRPWEGAMQTRYSAEHADLDGSGYGPVYETAAANPGLSVAFQSWRGAARHLEVMRRLANYSSVGVITRDQDSGEVKTDKRGEPTVHYTISQRDARRVQAGVAGASRILDAAGATRMFSGHQAGLEWTRASGEPLDAFIARCERAGYGPGRCSLAALHILGSARMGGSAETSAVNPDGVTWEVPDIVVADASTFPTASGVNPMISIEAIAYMNASRLAARLRG
ncbi:choline dehydrogenase-like flavoprotein [Microbacterium terrae]|uniref:long-chain-alcohol oxidase n=1 Tax=Microbacterium terrae TaxID=69369 RepID=A0A0M2GXT7_9MICO|nr:FAD-dependent oxidoreductase [Microbacterium terrae]KJL38784.1 Paromamine 6'-oxidase [Microbacterium terrae]MBP1076203.1 choline dehydrogenase-like flavoprotein [Microbacterium terrae]GLJ97024.1 GMC oxidoreductase [Microbacterium terrae]